MVVALVAKMLVGAEAVIGVLVEDLAIDLAVDLAIDLEVIVVAAALIELADVNVGIFVVLAMGVLEFTVPTSSEGFRC